MGEGGGGGCRLEGPTDSSEAHCHDYGDTAGFVTHRSVGQEC